jgi:hypothetical protein
MSNTPMKNKTSNKIIYGLFAMAIASAGLSLAAVAQKASAEWFGTSWESYNNGIYNSGISISADSSGNVSGEINANGTVSYCTFSVGNDDSMSPYTFISDFNQFFSDGEEISPGEAYGTEWLGNIGNDYDYLTDPGSVPSSGNAWASSPDGTGQSPSVTIYTYSSGQRGSSPCGASGATYGIPAQYGFSYSVDLSQCTSSGTWNTGISLPDGTSASTWFDADCQQGSNPPDTQQPPTDNFTTGTINVKADRNTSWAVSGGGTSFTGINETSDSYVAPASDSGTRYELTDLNSNAPYGFTDNPTFTMRNPSSILARVVKSVEASDCSGWTCYLTTNGTINYNLSSTYCNITVQTTVDGQPAAIPSGLTYWVSGGPSAYSETYNSTSNPPQSFQLVADPSGTQFTLNGFSPPSTITYNGKTADLVGVSPASTYTCNGGDSIVFTAAYTTRASINIH